MSHPLTVRDVVNLAAPSSWSASVMPCVLATAIGYKLQGSIPIDLTVCLFAVAILMQSAVNALNDYADFKKGTDTLENSPDASDAVIVYGLEPTTARNIGFAFLAIAFAVPGLYTILHRGIIPLVIGLVGAAIVVGYSFGSTPISYLPLGELVSGFVMGGLITFAGVHMLTGSLVWSVFAYAVPVMLGIGLIMFTNNGCDIERDLVAKRRTLPCLLGRHRTDLLYRVLLVVWLASPALIFLAMGSNTSAIVYCLELPAVSFAFVRHFSVQLGPEARGQAMGGIASLVVTISFAYTVAFLVG